MTSTFAGGGADATGVLSWHAAAPITKPMDKHTRATRYPHAMLFSVVDDLRWTDEP
ncbi:hypothetical protein F4827_003443 [Paraburkholderia bannensis]|uniref:Uncharacterized protein n=1 Tax=Paraburkholderia bannensis TaxID=765414 RepID=A0A7W9WU92_9BURK|nr:MULTISPECIES: hypothetical protein [Paraburkholderia]MBB3258575.1 hypothetical protein [Paraburkholderia sp. WP4_3_2]MBB6103588.1 hypothetical protein [Paraburkholderia bannensis]